MKETGVRCEGCGHSRGVHIRPGEGCKNRTVRGYCSCPVFVWPVLTEVEVFAL